MSSVTVKDNNKKYDELVKQLNEEAKIKSIAAGIFGDLNSEVLQYAIYNEFGTDKIPERSFIRATFDIYQDDIFKFVTIKLKEHSEAKITTDQLKKQFGEFLVSLIKKQIKFGEYEVNSDYTIAQKGSSKPLIDTGLMLKSISYKVNNESIVTGK
jgi:hypothetical protein